MSAVTIRELSRLKTATEGGASWGGSFPTARPVPMSHMPTDSIRERRKQTARIGAEHYLLHVFAGKSEAAKCAIGARSQNDFFRAPGGHQRTIRAHGQAVEYRTRGGLKGAHTGCRGRRNRPDVNAAGAFEAGQVAAVA